MINSEIDHLVRLISKLPGLGLRSARRIVLHLLNNKEKEMLVLSDEIKDVAERVKFCVICGNMDTSEECYICKDEKRDVSTICVVENVGDLWAIERSGVFSGKYHVLGGVLSALDNIGPDDLKIGQLVQRAKSEKISFCKVRIGGFEKRTKCLEDIPADIEINTDESGLRALDIYPYSPIPSNKDSYAIVLKVFNPKKSGLYQFHSYGQPKGKSFSSYLGSWTIVID